MDRTVIATEAPDEVTRLRRENAELRREMSLLKGGMDYLEGSKIPYLEKELERSRQGRG